MVPLVLQLVGRSGQVVGVLPHERGELLEDFRRGLPGTVPVRQDSVVAAPCDACYLFK